MIKKMIEIELNDLKLESGQDILKTTEHKPEQKQIIECIKNNENLWLHGKSGQGKSFLAAKAIKKYITNCKISGLKLWKWIEISDLINLFRDIYTENRFTAIRELNKIKVSNILIINDIDKMNSASGITSERESHIFSIIDRMQGQLIITSQYSMHEFCMMMPGEKEISKRDGVGPIERRLKEMCTEIEL